MVTILGTSLKNAKNIKKYHQNIEHCHVTGVHFYKEQLFIYN